MTKLTLLTPHERRRFDVPPHFTSEEKVHYFALNDTVHAQLAKLRTATNKVGFMLQLGYFKSQGKFFHFHQFRAADIQYVVQLLDIQSYTLQLADYQERIPALHRQKILSLLGWQPFGSTQQKQLTNYMVWHANHQSSPKQLFDLAIDYCWQRKIEVPSYNQLAFIITQSYVQSESVILQKLEKILSSEDNATLLLLVNEENKSTRKSSQQPLITRLRRINQSLRPHDIQENLHAFETIAGYFKRFQPIIAQLELASLAIVYFSTWVEKAQTFQLSQFSNPHKLYLHLLAYIQHQYYVRQDVLVDIFLKSVQSAVHAASKKMTLKEQSTRHERNQALQHVSSANKKSRILIAQITDIIKSSLAAPPEKVIKIETLLDDYHAVQDEKATENIIRLEESLDALLEEHLYFKALEALSLKLQHRIADIVKQVAFAEDTSDAKLIEAITYFKQTDGKLTAAAPLAFLKEIEKKAVVNDDAFNSSLYKILLFIHMADAIKSGQLNLAYSYRYKAIQAYLIEPSQWLQNKETLLRDAGLAEFADYTHTINTLKDKLHEKYVQVNQRSLQGENPYLLVEKERLLLKTPKIEPPDEKAYIASLLTQTGYVPILQILSDINYITQFVDCFAHFSIKHKKMTPHATTLLAGILGLGCNIGLNRLAHTSVGVTEDILRNTVTWCFSPKNIQAANTKIITLIHQLALAENLKRKSDQLHTGSDGRKVNVAVDCLHANYSYKYFGKGKGVTMYTFLDERQVLFHSQVISASEREAAFVMDGLLQNDVIKSDIHSTDTHGFTETVFAATHFINTAFAPRFKKVANQKIYAFKARKEYKKLDYPLLPSRAINQKLIKAHWDDILRFMATIKLKHATASQLFKRLSSYAKDHPLYKALKEFGRIIKSLFILTYYDDVELRQRIEKQLNKVELSNKFSNAVFFANNHEFKQGTKEEQEMATGCMVLIQNSIVLWNYLYLSQLLANNANNEQRQQMLSSIKQSSMIAWQHVNLHGEYDFTKFAANNSSFNMEKILTLKLS